MRSSTSAAPSRESASSVAFAACGFVPTRPAPMARARALSARCWQRGRTLGPTARRWSPADHPQRSDNAESRGWRIYHLINREEDVPVGAGRGESFGEIDGIAGAPDPDLEAIVDVGGGGRPGVGAARGPILSHAPAGAVPHIPLV